MKNILVVGDSFVQGMVIDGTLVNRLGSNNRFTFHGLTGGGNEAIAQITIDQLLLGTDFDYVLVMWSGISRIDLNISNAAFEQLTGNPFLTRTDTEELWYHSGGILGSWRDDNHKAIKNYLDFLYQNDSTEWHTNRTIKNIRIVSALAKSRNIPYDAGAIYDYTGKFSGTPVLGTATQDISQYLTIQSYPYDWCRNHNFLTVDNFHPTPEGNKEWLNSIKLKIDC